MQVKLYLSPDRSTDPPKCLTLVNKDVLDQAVANPDGSAENLALLSHYMYEEPGFGQMPNDRIFNVMVQCADLPPEWLGNKEAHIALSVNGNEILLDSAQMHLHIAHNTRTKGVLFADILGWTRVQLILTIDGVSTVWESPPVAVCMREKAAAKVKTMMQTVVYAYEALLKEPSKKVSVQHMHAFAKADSVDGHFLLDILKALEQQESYLRANAHFKMVPQAQYGSFEKVTHFTDKTLQHIVSHPEELIRTSVRTGIQVRGHHYVPKHTLVQSNAPSYDIPEHRAIIGFLKCMEYEINQDIRALKGSTIVSELVRTESKTPEGYMDMSSILLESHVLARGLARMAKVLESMRRDLLKLIWRYASIFQLSPEQIPIQKQIPMPSPLFRGVMAYRCIYEAMQRWYLHRETHASWVGQAAFFESLCSADLYELYVQVQLLMQLQSMGFEIEKAPRFKYQTYANQWQNRMHHVVNTYTLRKGEALVRFWIEPVIRMPSEPLQNGIDLVRANPYSISTGNGVRLEKRGKTPIYTPDYLISIDYPGQPRRWCVADAKYKTVSAVTEYNALDLIYKYLFGLRKTKAEDELLGVWALCGVQDNTENAPVLLPGFDGVQFHVEELADNTLPDVIDPVEAASSYGFDETQKRYVLKVQGEDLLSDKIDFAPEAQTLALKACPDPSGLPLHLLRTVWHYSTHPEEPFQ